MLELEVDGYIITFTKTQILNLVNFDNFFKIKLEKVKYEVTIEQKKDIKNLLMHIWNNMTENDKISFFKHHYKKIIAN